jgi:exodeoxyribonuclease VII small subunit
VCRHKLRHAEASLDRVFDSLDEDEEEPDVEEEEELDEEEEEENGDEPDDYQPGGPGRPVQPRLF